MRFPLVTILLTPPLAVVFWGLILMSAFRGVPLWGPGPSAGRGRT